MSPPAGVDRPKHTEFFAVNVNTDESDLHRIGPEELRRELPRFTFDYYEGALPSAEAETFSPRRSELWRGLLYAVLALLLTETFLAWRFGHHTI